MTRRNQESAPRAPVAPSRESVKEQIVTAGLALLKSEGIAALTQPRVARAAGVTQSHLTYYFPTRAKLLQGIAEHAVETAFEHLQPVTAATTQQHLLAEIRRVVEEGIPPRTMIGLVVAADSDPEIRKLMRVVIRRVRAMIATKLMQAGLDADEEQVLLFHASIVGLAVMHLARQSRESAREVGIGVEASIRRLGSRGQKRN